MASIKILDYYKSIFSPDKYSSKNFSIGCISRVYVFMPTDLLLSGISTYTLGIHPINGITEQLTIPAAIDVINRKRIGAIFTDGNMKSTDYKLRRYAADINLPLVLNGRLSLALSKALGSKLSYKEMSDYIINGKKQVGARARRN